MSLFALAGFASGAGAAGSDPYSLHAEALLGASATDLALRVQGPALPAVLEKVQVKADDATRNFFDVPSPGGVAALRLTGLARGERLQVRAHVKDGPQHNLETSTNVLRRPDLTVTGVDVQADIVRTHPFNVTAHVAEVGGDVSATARVELFDGATRIGASDVVVPADGAAEAAFRITLTRPGDHTLNAVVTRSTPDEWDEAPNARERQLYVNHYVQNGVVATDHGRATAIGAKVLRDGGNAFDAAIAVQFALNVVQPHLNGIGGGSNIIVRDGKTGEVFAIDARETAPAATTPTTYAGAVNQVRPNGFAVGVPGTVRAIDYLLRRWGTKTLAELLDPARRPDSGPAGDRLLTARDQGDLRTRRQSARGRRQAAAAGPGEDVPAAPAGRRGRVLRGRDRTSDRRGAAAGGGCRTRRKDDARRSPRLRS